MMTLDEIIQRLAGRPDRTSLQHYIEHEWIRPLGQSDGWHFEEIDIARAQLVHHLHRELLIEEHTMDIVLSLLDQLYATHDRVRLLQAAIGHQPQKVRDDIHTVLQQFSGIYADA